MRKASEATLDSIKQFVDAEKIKRVVYMHADHFEPWRGGLKQENADDIVAFAEMARKSDFTRRLSLFYKPDIMFNMLENAGPYRCVAGEPIKFLYHEGPKADIARQAIQQLMREGSHEFNVHVHHEGFTCAGARYVQDISDWLASHSDPKKDADRFEIFLQLTLDAIRAETGLPLDRWGFVHGNWALNGSDHSICRIGSEMAILQRNGCFGDFTFPAGRSGVNPRLEHPFTCIPIDADRAYDLPEADPRPVLPSPDTTSKERFFIWASPIKHGYCGIDYSNPRTAARMLDTEDIVLRWMRDSVRFTGTVYIKTHAHSMSPHYWDGFDVPIIPHLHPTMQTICGQLADVCMTLGIPLEFGTAQSIYDEFITGGKPASPGAKS